MTKHSAIPGLRGTGLGEQSNGHPLRVCVVTSEIVGPTRNGGIGTATSGLVQHLVADGHKVTVLYTHVSNGSPSCTEGTWEYWISELSARNIQLLHIPHKGNYADWRLKSWHVMTFLRAQEYDVVYFNEHHGSGYFSLAAKKAGLNPFAQQIHCVITHGSIEWVSNNNDQYIVRSSDLEMIGLERRSVEWADAVIGPSQYLLREYEKYGWKLPTHTYCQPYPLLREAGEYDPLLRRRIDELVFFGRLEPRKGLWLFCSALDRLSETLRGKTVTFMGRMTDISGVPSGALIIERAAAWPFRVRLLTEFGPQEAIDYLKRPGKLAVMPSIADNSPCVVYECMENGIPFVTTLGSGADELVHPDAWSEVMVEPVVSEISERLANILDSGAKLGKPRFDPKENLASWSKWHAWLSTGKTPFTLEAGKLAALPGADGDADAVETLFVTIDLGIDLLRTVVNNVRCHVKRFGPDIGHLIITSRREPLTSLLAELLIQQSAAGASVIVVDVDELSEARDIILASKIVFFAGSEQEVLSPFFATAFRLLSSGRATVVSCVVADRDSEDGELVVQELPCGDIPAVGALQWPINSGIWAADVSKLKEEFSDLEFDYPEYGALVSAEMLGHFVVTRCRIAGMPYLFVPEVGGVRNRSSDIGRQRSNWYTNASRIARDLGIGRTVHPHVAPWYAMHLFGSEREHVTKLPLPFLSALPDKHPLKSLSQSAGDLADAANLAASFGRPSLAIQLGIVGDGQPDRAEHLLDLATKAMSSCCEMDLLQPIATSSDLVAEELAAQSPAAVRQSIVEAALSHGRNLAELPFEETVDRNHERAPIELNGDSAKLLEMVHVCPDRIRILAAGKGIQLQRESTNEESSRLVLLDVPLAGHAKLSARLLAVGQTAARVTMSIFDQEVGDLIGTVSARPSSLKAECLDIDLHGIYCLSCIALDIATSRQAEAAIQLESFIVK